MGFKRFEIKQKLQYLPFPDGIMYNKETDTVRTGRVNALFVETSVLTELLKKKPNDNFEENYHLASGVALHGHFSNHFIPDLTRLANLLTA